MDEKKKLTSNVDRDVVLRCVIDAQQRYNRVYKLLEPIKKALDDLDIVGGTLYELFDYITTEGELNPLIDPDSFFSFTSNDEKETIYNAAIRRMEEK